MRKDPLKVLAIGLEDATREDIIKACGSQWSQFKLFSESDKDITPSVIKAYNPDIIILDVDYADTGVSSIITRAKNLIPLSMIALSYASDVSKTIRILEEGADCFMLKPIHQRELVAHVDSLLKNVSRYSAQSRGKTPGETLDEVPRG
ncbi:MAG: hypothetical protein JW954_08380 [Dehalococcoidaceae bacterium]|nr:hypothetical protein [Dehalococcoidaceae bacterium]